MNTIITLVECKCSSCRWLTTNGGFIVCAQCGVKLEREGRDQRFKDRTWLNFQYRHYAIVQRKSVFSALDELVSA